MTYRNLTQNINDNPYQEEDANSKDKFIESDNFDTNNINGQGNYNDDNISSNNNRQFNDNQHVNNFSNDVLETNEELDKLLAPSTVNPFLTSNERLSEAYSRDNEENDILLKSENSYDRISNVDDQNITNSNSQTNLGSPYGDYRGYYSKTLSSNNKEKNFDTNQTDNTNINRTNNRNSNRYSNNSENLNNFDSFSSTIDHSNTVSNNVSSGNGRHISTSMIVKGQPLADGYISTPKPYDRYPIVSSNVPKLPYSTSGNSNSSNMGGIQNNVDPIHESAQKSASSGSSTTSYNLLNEKDFSPFGGYPQYFFPLNMDEKENDDYLHNPNSEEEAKLDRRRMWDDLRYMNKKSCLGLVGILTLFCGAMAIFIVLPALTFTGYVDHTREPIVVVTNLTTIQYLTQYKYPQLSAIRTSLIDSDTPDTALKRKAKDGSSWELVFSDEFNAEGRSFYDGDDQFWTSPDFQYSATKDLEWYTPDAVTTVDGTLQLRMDAYKNHGLNYRSGMVQSWNKLCFTQGAVEISANLPNYGRVSGLWPGLWTMGNIARPGYLASTEGIWPYSYDSCDAGITPNQSSPDGISYLPGQRLSACTCDGEDHPNLGYGRGAPEIDIIEGEIDTTLGVGIASQSLQIAPFDIWYIPDYDFIEIYNFTTTTMNSYTGGPFQQAVSAVSTLNSTWYEFGPEAGYFQKYSIEYLNDDDDGYIRWFVGDTPTFTIYSTALHPNGNIGWRTISKEPMSMIMNLGISNSWAYIDWKYLFFPVTMSIDYVRVYQPSDSVSVTCDPEDYPTYDYIQEHLEAYTNHNLTSWKEAGYTFPLNKLTGNCDSSAYDARKNKR